MEMIADGLLIATAMTAGLYCLVLGRRLRKLTESGAGIGPQIEALDKALSETRTALNETREGVSELRGSAKAAIAQLSRETARCEEVAERIEGAADDAKATMQRLYEVRDRIESHEGKPEVTIHKLNSVSEKDPEDDAAASSGDDPSDVRTPDRSEPKGVSGTSDGLGGPKVALPEGDVVEPEAAFPVASSAAPENADARRGSVLKAERVML